MKKIYLLFAFISMFISGIAQTVQSPEEFLGYEPGERFTRHHRVVDYFKHVAKNAVNVQLQQYGETYEHRPLIMAILSSPENMERLEEIRTSNLARTGMIEGKPSAGDIAIVWMSYNIHGNESSSIEAAMKTLYSLITEDRAKEWLKNTVVIIDPCVNPDGRDRYANFYNQNGNKNFNPDGDAIEHHEPWPGGRPNHYLFDLNRDWAWQTQIESLSRSKVYHQWMPHVHVDFHEQSHNSPYYFAPAAEPLHEVITPWQREFQVTIGKNHAKYFDKSYWLYFTKERFDLLYPSYGDTYPTYNGAIGMTYEQAGGGYAGLGIATEYGDTLTLKDRVMHHFTTGISTVEVTSQHAKKVVDEFDRYFDQNINDPDAVYKTYVIKSTNDADKINNLIKFLDKQHIQYGTARLGKPAKGFSYLSNTSSSVSVNDKDLVISVYQPMSKLITALFEPVTKLSDTLTYDITAWSIPYVYGLDVYALTERVNISGKYSADKEPVTSTPEGMTPYAYLLEYNSLEDVKFLAAILKEGINARVAHKPLNIEGKQFSRGSIVITRRTNERFGADLDKIISAHALEFSRQVFAVTTGFAESGLDLGSSDVARIKIPEIAVVTGPQTSSLSFGEIWHFFERQINYPVTNISTNYIKSVNLYVYDVLIVPNGYYSLFNDDFLNTINEWVRMGGKLIVMGNGLNAFKDKKGYGLKEFGSEKEQKEEQEKDPSIEEQLKPFASQERNALSGEIFGAIFKVDIDNTHPLAYGYDQSYFTLKTNNLKFAFLKEGGNVGVIRGKAEPVSGFAGFKATDRLENSLVFGVESQGRGQVIYMVDNPLFRAFWENGKMLFSNAVFLVGNH